MRIPVYTKVGEMNARNKKANRELKMATDGLEELLEAAATLGYKIRMMKHRMWDEIYEDIDFPEDIRKVINLGIEDDEIVTVRTTYERDDGFKALQEFVGAKE